MTTVVLVGTLDTKGDEYAYLADRISEHGVDVVLVDAGIVGEPRAKPDVTREEVAQAVGASVAALAAAGDRGAAVETMARGAAEVVQRLHAEGRLDAIGGLGGSGGSALVTHAMRALPIGVPKLMVSTVASGDTSPYVGSVDVTMMYSVVDIAGINQVSARIMSNAAGALAGMAKATVPELGGEKPIVVASMFGVTTPAVTTARERLEELGYEVLVFHQTGAGGGSMEKLLAGGFVVGSLDVTTTEFCDQVAGGVLAAVPGAARVGRGRGHPAGRLARRARHGQLRADGLRARALSRPEPLRPQPDDHADADDAGRVPRDRAHRRAQAERGDAGRPCSSCRCAASR